jgi:hypothetical protein
MSSSKNRLQELWQKQCDVLPTYDTGRIGGTDHAPKYRSTTTLPDGKTFRGTVEGSRTVAELAAASAAIHYSRSVSVNSEQPFFKITNHQSFVFVDLENIPKAISLIDYLGADSCVGFVSKKHPLATSSANKMRTFIVTSYAKDAADFALAMSVAMFIRAGECDQYKRLIILTKDHFGAAVTDVLQQWWASTDVYHAITMMDCLKNVV